MTASITPSAAISIKDSEISPNPNPIPLPGTAIACPTGTLVQEMTLPAATSNISLPFPAGVTTAAIIIFYPVLCPDLVVTFGGQVVAVPIGCPFFLYAIAGDEFVISSVKGGKILYSVGG